MNAAHVSNDPVTARRRRDPRFAVHLYHVFCRHLSKGQTPAEARAGANAYGLAIIRAEMRERKRPYFSAGSAFRIYLRLFRILRRNVDVSTARREVRGHILKLRTEHVRHLMEGAA